jgi:hypothetical protein
MNIEQVVKSLRARLDPDSDQPLAQRPWRMWGSELRAVKPGGDPANAELSNSELIATFKSHPSKTGGSHVAELYFVRELVAALPDMLDALEKYRAALTLLALHDTRAVAAALDMQTIAAAALKEPTDGK